MKKNLFLLRVHHHLILHFPMKQALTTIKCRSYVLLKVLKLQVWYYLPVATSPNNSSQVIQVWNTLIMQICNYRTLKLHHNWTQKCLQEVALLINTIGVKVPLDPRNICQADLTPPERYYLFLEPAEFYKSPVPRILKFTRYPVLVGEDFGLWTVWWMPQNTYVLPWITQQKL